MTEENREEQEDSYQDEILCDGCQNDCSECEFLTDEFKDWILSGKKHSEFMGKKWR